MAHALPGDADARRLLAERVLTDATTAARDLLSHFEVPREQLEAALEAAAEAAQPSAAAGAEALLALALLRLGDDGGARAAAERAVSGFTLEGGADPLELFWQECGPVAFCVQSGRSTSCSAPEIDEAWATGRRFYAARYLPSLWAWRAGSEPDHDPRPAIRLGDALIPQDTGPSWPLFSTLMPALRDRVRDETGIIVPGALFLDGPNLTPAEFEISIAGLAAERSPVPAQGIDPMVFVVDRLEEALRTRLEQFVTLDDAMELLKGAPDGGERCRPTAPASSAWRRSCARWRPTACRSPGSRSSGARPNGPTARRRRPRRSGSTRRRAPPGRDAVRLLELPEAHSKGIDEVFDLDAGRFRRPDRHRRPAGSGRSSRAGSTPPAQGRWRSWLATSASAGPCSCSRAATASTRRC